MRKVQLYIATSLDGFIARPDGGLDWLPHESSEDYGYDAFVAGTDTTLMGYETYAKILTFEGPFPYPNHKNFVFTRKNRQKTDYVEFISENIAGFVQDLKQENGKNIWLVGGGQINTMLLNEGLVDEIFLFTVPMLIGEGIPVFAPTLRDTRLRVAESRTYPSGMQFVRYEVLK